MTAENDLDDTRSRIVEAAGDTFANKGFDDATVREICQQAGANLAAVNYYFGDKQRLYVEAVKRAHVWRMEQVELPQWPLGTPPEQRLADFILTFVRRMLLGGGETWHSRLMMRELFRPDSACGEVVHEYIRPQFDLLLEILRELTPANMTTEQLHLTAFSIVGQCLHYRLADPVTRKLIEPDEYAGYDAEKLAHHITQFSLAALGHTPTLAAVDQFQN